MTTWERVTAADLRPGDQFASTRTQEPATVAELGIMQPRSRCIRLDDGARIRPRHDTKFWRVVA